MAKKMTPLDTTSAPAPATPAPAPDSEPETVANNVGEVTATDEDTLEIDLGDEVMVIKPKEEASEPAPAPAAETPAASADCGGAAPASGQAAGATATESLNQTFEDFLKGL